MVKCLSIFIKKLTGWFLAERIRGGIKNALMRAEKTVRNMRWFEVAETRGYIENGKIGHWQVTLKIGFTLEDA